MSNLNEPMSTQKKLIIVITAIFLFFIGGIIVYRIITANTPTQVQPNNDKPLFGEGANDILLGSATSTNEETNVRLTGGPATELTTTTVNPGDSAVISWASPDAVSCVASGDDKTWFFTGGSPVGTFETPPVTKDTTYAISCTDKDGNTTRKTVLVSIKKPSTIARVTTSFSNFFSGNQTTTGTTSARYFSTNTGSNSIRASYAGPITSTSRSSSGLNFSLSASKSRVTQGETSQISWSFSGGGECTASGAWSGQKQPTGSETLSSIPIGYNSYTLLCKSSTGEFRTKTISITGVSPTPTITSFTADASRVSSGSTTILRWESVNTTSCSTDTAGKWGTQSTSLPPNGTAPTGTLTNTLNAGGIPYRFTLKCVGAPGSISTTKTLTVYTDQEVGPRITLHANPPTISNILLSNKTTLDWKVEGNATSCTATGAWLGDKPLIGTEVITVTTTGQSHYVLDCTYPGGTKSWEVVVTAILPPPVINMSVGGSLGQCDGRYYANIGSPLHISWNTNQEALCKTSGGVSGSGWNDSSVSGHGSKNILFIGPNNDTYYLTCNSGSGESSNSVSVRNFARYALDCLSDPSDWF